jgi:hypothetical protein
MATHEERTTFESLNIMACVFRAEIQNKERLLHHRKVHKVSLGPYIPGMTSPPHCLDCGKPKSEWASLSEECHAG